MIDTIVTRHPGLIDYLQEIGLADASTEVIAHAAPDNVRGKHVCGVLPHSLSCLTASFTEVPLSLPAELRGAELTLDQVRKYAGEPVTYQVTRRHACQGCGGKYWTNSPVTSCTDCPE